MTVSRANFELWEGGVVDLMPILPSKDNRVRLLLLTDCGAAVNSAATEF